MAFPIGEVARATGITVQTVRYYEELGLLPAPPRTAGNRRVYGPELKARLAFIRHARELGFPLPDIRELLAMGDRPEQSCAKADRIASAHLAEVDRKIARLSALRDELRRMIRQCRRGRVADCRVIEVLADHSHSRCATADHAHAAGRALD